jgi:hypothetical protein
MNYSPLQEKNIFSRLEEESRYVNMVLKVNVQSVVLLPQEIKQGSTILICKRLNDQDEARVVGKLMNFSSREQEAYMLSLPVDEAIYIDKSKAPIPIAAKIPEYPTQYIPDVNIHNYQKDVIYKIIGLVVREKPKIKVVQNEDELSYESRIILKDLKEMPFEFQDERADRLDLNISVVNTKLKELVEQGWLEEYKMRISLGKSKGMFKLLLFTNRATKLFGKHRLKGKGLIKHSFWQYRCAKYYRLRNYKVEIEYFIPDTNQSIDVIAENKKERIAIEIELNDTPQIEENILKCMKEGFDRIVLAVYRTNQIKRIQKIIMMNPEMEEWLRQERIQIELLSSFLT